MASLAFAAPILPGKLTAWKQFAAELNGPRRAAFAAQQRRIGMTCHRAYLQQTPNGDFVIVYTEGKDPGRSMGAIGASKVAFDVWFKAQVKAIHGIDLTKPPAGPLSVQALDYKAR